MYQYRRKIRSDMSRTYLWGSETIARSYRGGGALVVHVEDMSETITLFVVKKNPFRDDDVKIGTLEPGGVFTVELHGTHAVFAEAPPGKDGYVTCAILETEFDPGA